MTPSTAPTPVAALLALLLGVVLLAVTVALRRVSGRSIRRERVGADRVLGPAPPGATP